MNQQKLEIVARIFREKLALYHRLEKAEYTRLSSESGRGFETQYDPKTAARSYACGLLNISHKLPPQMELFKQIIIEYNLSEEEVNQLHEIL